MTRLGLLRQAAAAAGRSGGGAPAGPPEFVASEKATTTVGTLIIAVPAGVQAGDLLLWVSTHRNSNVAGGGPTGFTTIFHEDTSNGNDMTYAAYKVADGTEGASLSVTVGEQGDGVGILSVFRETGAFVRFEYQLDTPEEIPAVVASPGDLVVAVAATVLGSEWEPISDVTDIDVVTRAANESLRVGWKIAASESEGPFAVGGNPGDGDDGYAVIVFAGQGVVPFGTVRLGRLSNEVLAQGSTVRLGRASVEALAQGEVVRVGRASVEVLTTQ